MRVYLDGKSEEELLDILQEMLPQVRSKLGYTTVVDDEENETQYMPSMKWLHFADHVEALIELTNSKGPGAKYRKYSPLSCAIAYRLLMKRYDKKCLQDAVGDINEGMRKSECASVIICNLACIEEATLVRHRQANKDRFLELLSLLVKNDKDPYHNFHFPNAPGDTAKFMMEEFTGIDTFIKSRTKKRTILPPE